MTIPRVECGDPLSAARQNELIDQVNALSRPGVAGRSHPGSAGAGHPTPPQMHVAIFELSESLNYPNTSGAPTDHFDREPTPFAQAQMVWCNQFQTSDVAGDGTPIRSYGGTSYSPQEVVWYPSAQRNGAGYAVGTSPFATGDRVTCVWNRQSGRWEIVCYAAPPAQGLSYAKVQSNYANFLLDASGNFRNNYELVLRQCAWDGSNETGPVLKIELPSLGDSWTNGGWNYVPPTRSPAFFVDDVVQIVPAPAGNPNYSPWAVFDYGAHIDAGGGSLRMVVCPITTFSVPRGWSLCDGTAPNGAGTPDLRDRFPIGANLTARTHLPGQTGGSGFTHHFHGPAGTTDLPRRIRHSGRGKPHRRLQHRRRHDRQLRGRGLRHPAALLRRGHHHAELSESTG